MELPLISLCRMGFILYFNEHFIDTDRQLLSGKIRFVASVKFRQNTPSGKQCRSLACFANILSKGWMKYLNSIS